MDPVLAVTLRALMRRKDWNAYRHLLSDESFPNAQAAAIYSMLSILHDKNRRNVTENALRLSIHATYGEDRAAELGTVVDAIMEVSRGDLDDAEYAIPRYAANGLATKAARMVLVHGDDPKFEYDIPARIMGQAAQAARGKLQERVDASKGGLPGDPDMVRRVVPLGLHAGLDKELAGGVGNGELLIVLAPPERGKTSYLWRMATNAALEHHRVAAYTLEIATYKCKIRYYQSLTGMTTSELIANRQEVSARRAQAARKGSMLIHNFNQTIFTPSMLDADIEQMFDEGLNPTYIMVDYLELMQPDGTGYNAKRDWQSLGLMVNQVRQTAQRYDIPIVTAWQVKREGALKDLFTTTDVSESWECIKLADIIIGLNQSEAEQGHNVMRIRTMKQREDPSRQIWTCYSDMRRNVITEIENREVALASQNLNARKVGRGH